MHKDVGRTAHVLALSAALLVPLMQTAHAVEMRYARAIGEPYMPAPTSAPADPARADSAPPPTSSPPNLPTLGSDAPAPAVAQNKGWSLKRVLVGVVIVGAIAALAKGGGGGNEPAAANSGGGTVTPPGSGGSGGPLPIPIPGIGGGNPGGDNGGRGRDRSVLSGMALSF